MWGICGVVGRRGGWRVRGRSTSPYIVDLPVPEGAAPRLVLPAEVSPGLDPDPDPFEHGLHIQSVPGDPLER